MRNDQKNKKNLISLALVMLVNALGYGVIIPLMYPYATKFGINPVGLSLLFASFSLAQFIATPIIGRLSDKYGRKPLLVFSLIGTSLSLLLFGLARTLPLLFLARIIDGATGGNVSVAQAAIADSVNEKDRAQAFGILGAAFGVGFVLGPAVGGYLSQWGLSVPFYFGSALALLAVLMTIFLFKETNFHRESKPEGQKLINIRGMVQALGSEHVGKIFWVSLLFMTATNAMIIGFQTTTVDVFTLDATQIGLLFAMYGVITVIMQAGGIRFLVKRVNHKRTLIQASLILSAITLIAVAISPTAIWFALAMLVFGVVSAPVSPVLIALLSERSRAEDQGGMLGINQSYTSLAQIIGPLMAGQIAGFSVQMVFVGAAVLVFLALWPSRLIGVKVQEVDL